MTDLNMKILMVDDCSVMRRIVKNLLKELGYTDIEDAEDGEQAYSMLIKAALTGNPFDLIILDYTLQKIEILDFLNIIRGEKETKDIPVLIVVPFDKHGDADLCLSMGANDYIIKPFPDEVLAEKIDKIFEKIKSE